MYPPATSPAAAPATVTTPEPAPAPAPVKDGRREVVETIVFVLVLVLLLKTFVAEAFVIPTGSMAETLYGYQKIATCPECGLKFPVNCSTEVEPQGGNAREEIIGCTCPNCRLPIKWRDVPGRPTDREPGWSSGDRVLVTKFPFDADRLGRPARFNTVVFKYPEKPQDGGTPMNYIKRLIGLPGETVAIANGNVYLHTGLKYDDATLLHPDDPRDAWVSTYTHANAEHAMRAFEDGEFRILRKPPAQMLAMSRLVYDNDHQARDLIGRVPPRWQPSNPAAWTPDDKDAQRKFTQSLASDATAWLRYRHLVADRTALASGAAAPGPDLIRNVMGYNTGLAVSTVSGMTRETQDDSGHWVGDLMLECTARVGKAQGGLTLELSKEADRFQARFDLTTGDCTLVRLAPTGETVLDTRPSKVSSPGSYALRFANYDDRLTLWVNGSLVFGDGVEYPASRSPKPNELNDKEPASVGVRGDAGVELSRLKLSRDTYYTTSSNNGKGGGPVMTLYVQPGHYLCLGDNSTQSSDGRYWGSVPARLILGRALGVYWPLDRVGPIR